MSPLRTRRPFFGNNCASCPGWRRPAGVRRIFERGWRRRNKLLIGSGDSCGRIRSRRARVISRFKLSAAGARLVIARIATAREGAGWAALRCGLLSLLDQIDGLKAEPRDLLAGAAGPHDLGLVDLAGGPEAEGEREREQHRRQGDPRQRGRAERRETGREQDAGDRGQRVIDACGQRVTQGLTRSSCLRRAATLSASLRDL